MAAELTLRAEAAANVPYPGPAERALAFLRDPRRSLARVAFIRNLNLDGPLVRADLAVNVPFLGDYLLDFESELIGTPGGADLLARPRSGRAWAEVSGEGRLTADGLLVYALRLTAHLQVPGGGPWGTRAFTRMAEATAASTLEKVAGQLEPALRAAAVGDAARP